MVDVQADLFRSTYGSVPVGKTTAGLNGGRKRVLHDFFDADADEDGTDVLIGLMTRGPIIYDWIISTDGLGAGVTCELVIRLTDGTELPFSEAVDVSAEALHRPTGFEQSILPRTISFNGDIDIIAKLAGGESTGNLKVTIFYAIV